MRQILSFYKIESLRQNVGTTTNYGFTDKFSDRNIHFKKIISDFPTNSGQM
ncbi:hypothetical protein LEP1GSC079_3431 [Leptospira interrogans str. FPW1039]|uniref:Uncharacterized protein n=2 Tax=Leptospira interrogans TaxID=173 RepID=A0A0F6H3H7_LEPIR|nr:hypothetical protein LEP1GSC045_4506 [Leptospira interrogans serovar Pomona str. Kennewicki LC82-25]EJP05149.1 hypothetical protein LEP1GSC007_1097 [Leptospira interrogans serovar Bulgarica str. Mallika]EKN98140.1 hypothetical protein LEP1GSC014_1093 [Leptospira interrogans serovar Pomona str. Pomona]EKO22740.1 hypothetical protein LEP1GSC104_1475 [Leptospira interrogans str. UI 12621]EKR26795.1 hypothetical protein LEP1GSC087_3861 [Leptospira interrogans serovar Bataviae str. L1111]EKR8291